MFASKNASTEKICASQRCPNDCSILPRIGVGRQSPQTVLNALVKNALGARVLVIMLADPQQLLGNVGGGVLWQQTVVQFQVRDDPITVIISPNIQKRRFANYDASMNDGSSTQQRPFDVLVV